MMIAIQNIQACDSPIEACDKVKYTFVTYIIQIHDSLNYKIMMVTIITESGCDFSTKI